MGTILLVVAFVMIIVIGIGFGDPPPGTYTGDYN